MGNLLSISETDLLGIWRDKSYPENFEEYIFRKDSKFNYFSNKRDSEERTEGKWNLTKEVNTFILNAVGVKFLVKYVDENEFIFEQDNQIKHLKMIFPFSPQVSCIANKWSKKTNTE